MRVPAADALEEKAAFLRDALSKSRSNTERLVSTLGSIDHRLSALGAALIPAEVRTSAIRIAHENIVVTLKTSDAILAKFHFLQEAEQRIHKGLDEDLDGYLLVVEQLRGLLRFFNSKKNFGSSQNNVVHVLGKAVNELEREFDKLLREHSNPADLLHSIPNSEQQSASPRMLNESGNSITSRHSDNQAKTLQTKAYTPQTLITPGIFPVLRRLAQQLVQAGHEEQCSIIYGEARFLDIEKCLTSIGVKKVSEEEMQKFSSEELHTPINAWISSMRTTVKLLFPRERQLCEQIFEGLDPLKDKCFSEVTRRSIMALLSLGKTISNIKMLPERLFVFLDMYEVMHELQPEMEIIFEGKSHLDIREDILSLTKKLAQTAQGTWGNFVDVVKKNVTKPIVVEGTHPLTSYVINYVKFLFDYRATLKQLFLELEPTSVTRSNLTSVTMDIMLALQTNLDVKFEQYNDKAMAHLFLMNNIHYIVKSIQRSDGKDLLGDDWIQKLGRIVQRHANQYKKIILQRILGTSSAQGLTFSKGSGNDAWRAAMKDRLMSFNFRFEDVIQRHREWAVPDQELRENLILALAEVILPAYGFFIRKLKEHTDEKYFDDLQKDIKLYTDEQLEEKLRLLLIEVKSRSESKG